MVQMLPTLNWHNDYFDGNGGSAGNAAVMVMEGDDGGDDNGLIHLVLVQLVHTPKQYDLHSELIDSS